MKNRRPLKLKTILILFMAIIVFMTLGVSGIISFRMFKSSMIENIGDSRVDVLSQISEKVSAVKSNAELLSSLYYYNENLSDLYHKEGYSEEEKRQIEDNFVRIEELSAVTTSAVEMEFYYTFLVDNGYVYSSNPGAASGTLEEYESKIWFPEVLEKGEKWISTYQDGEGNNVISIARSLKDRNGNDIGLFLFNLYEENFSRIYDGLSDKNDIYIVDEAGNIVSHKNKELLGIRFYDTELLNRMFEEKSSLPIKKTQKDYLFSISRNKEIGWIMVEEIPMELLLDDVNSIQGKMVSIGALILIIGILVCSYISWKTTRPLGELVHELENVGRSEDMEQSFEIRGWSEIDKICQECNYMTERIRNLMTAIKTSEKKKRMAEMGFLQSQMSPHFLYNTLFSIRCLVDMGDKEKAIGIIDAFTSILKYILSYKSEFVDVAMEIKFLKDYAVLQKYRYGDQFDLEIRCEPELYEKKLLRMILEPLVENSLFHGMSDEKQKIHVVVEFAIDGEELLITVTDDGVGFTDENCMRLNQKMREGKQSNLIGMNNIRDRIKMTFGKKYGLSIDLDYQEGARTIVKLPVLD